MPAVLGDIINQNYTNLPNFTLYDNFANIELELDWLKLSIFDGDAYSNDEYCVIDVVGTTQKAVEKVFMKLNSSINIVKENNKFCVFGNSEVYIDLKDPNLDLYNFRYVGMH